MNPKSENRPCGSSFFGKVVMQFSSFSPLRKKWYRSLVGLTRKQRRTVEVPGSRSTRIVRAWSERPRARLTETVLLPTPPLPEETGRMVRLELGFDTFVGGE